MSRHEFEQPGVRLAIGWDAPLSTFYLQVWSEALQTAGMDEEERETPQIWLGTEYAEHLSPNLPVALARLHLPDLPAGILDSLNQEMHAEPARPLSSDHHEIRLQLEALLKGTFAGPKRPQFDPADTVGLMEAILE